MTVQRDDFDAFFAAAWPRLYRTAYGLTGEREAAEDAVQSALAKAYASWRRIRRVAAPEAYVRRMVVNEVLGVRRRAWFRKERSWDRVPEPSGNSSETAASLDRQLVWEAVRALPPRQRAVIVLRYYEDYSEAQIAEALGCSPGTVKSQAARALARLRQHADFVEGRES